MCFFEEKMKKKTKKESHKKKWETILQDTKKRDKHGQTKCKKCPTKKGNRQNYSYGEVKRKQKKKVLQKCTRTHNKNIVKRFLVGKTKRQQKTKKFFFKRAARRKQRENTERQKREQVDSGRTRWKIKRQGRHSKKNKVEKVFWCGNSEEIKKKKCQNEPAQIFKEKSLFCWKKKEGIFRPLKINKKCKQMRNLFFFKKKTRVCIKRFFEKKKTFFFTCCFSFFFKKRRM